jgi:hypothetical protein
MATICGAFKTKYGFILLSQNLTKRLERYLVVVSVRSMLTCIINTYILHASKCGNGQSPAETLERITAGTASFAGELQAMEMKCLMML